MSDRELENVLHSLEVTALNFGYRWCADNTTRQWYIQQTQELTRRLRQEHASGILSARRAAEIAQAERNKIMEAARLRTSDIGRAGARSMKPEGRALQDLVARYANERFQRPFEQLTRGQQDEVLMDVVDSAGRSKPQVNARMGRLAAAGRVLWVASAVIAMYNIAVAEDRVHAAGREAANLAGGVAGGAAAGALAGIWFGPLGVAVGVAVGGVVGALIADEAYTELTTPNDPASPPSFLASRAFGRSTKTAWPPRSTTKRGSTWTGCPPSSVRSTRSTPVMPMQRPTPICRKFGGGAGAPCTRCVCTRACVSSWPTHCNRAGG